MKTKKKEQRRIVIGDVHGCIVELKELLDKCKYEPGADRLIFVGDLVDKGPDSRAVVNLAMELHAECVLGNHDEKHLRWNRWLRKIEADPNVKNPMKDNGFFWKTTEEEQDYFESMPLWILDGDWCIVHAGLECDGRWPHQMDPKVMLRMRDVHWKTGRYLQGTDPLTRKEGAVRWGAVRWAKRWEGPVSVIYGHAPSYRVKTDRANGRVCLGVDTGAVHGGYLTAVIYESGGLYELVQVRCPKYAEPFTGEEDYVRYAEPDDPELVAGPGPEDVG